jgi:hypothetical protein
MMSPSAACAECRTLIGGYVLEALEPHEAETVHRHLADCPECAAEHARLADLPALLAFATEDDSATEAPPAALEEAVLDRFAREHRTDRVAPAPPKPGRPRRGRLPALLRPLRRPLPAAAAGALTAAAVAAALVAVTNGGDDAKTRGEVFGARLNGSALAPDAHAYARLETSSSGTRVWMKVHGLPGNPAKSYELWCVRDDGTKVSAGTFRVDAHGGAEVNLTTAAVPGEYHVMSVERKADAPGPGQRIMAGEIQY